MNFGLSQPQLLVQRSLREALRRHASIERVREVMATAAAWDAELHAVLAELDLTATLVPESQHGTGLELLDAVVVAQELGRAVAPLSFHNAYVMAPLALTAAVAAGDERAAGLQRSLVEGRPSTVAAGSGISVRGGVLNGRAMVADPTICECFAVFADDDAELLLLPSDARGVEIEPLLTVDDTRRVGYLICREAPLDDAWRIPIADTPALRDRVLQAGRIVLAADALGAAQRGLEIAVDYAKERRQFDRVIASFQAVKHMCAETVAALDPVQSLLWYAAWAWDQELEEAPQLAALTKAHATEAATEAVSTCTQVFGGIGFTDECDMHLYFKRVGYDRQLLGGPQSLLQAAAAAALGEAGAGSAATA